MAAAAVGTKIPVDFPTSVTNPKDKWLLGEGLLVYFDTIYPLLIEFFNNITQKLELSRTRPLRVIAVGSFAKHLYEPTQLFGDFDFQVYEIQSGNKYSSEKYRQYVSEVITLEWETDIKNYLSKYIIDIVSRINAITVGRYSHLPFNLITNEIDPGSPPGPLKISIQYKEGHDASPIKIVDINYSKQNVLAYNDIGLEVMEKFDGNIPTVLYPIKKYLSPAPITDFIRTLQPCVFYEEKLVLSGMKDTGITEEKIKYDLEFWKDQCENFERTYRRTFIPVTGRKTGKTGKTGKKRKSLGKRTRKNRKSAKSSKN